MSDFLAAMAEGSAARAAAARSREPEPALLARALAAAPARPIVFDPRGFDLIAEVKRRAPSSGTLASADAAGPAGAAARAEAYARAGAAAVSVLTEPDSFGGSLADLAAAASVGVPVLRKDFLVEPYQVLEARAAGASGVLLIVRMLEGARLDEMLDAAFGCGLFVLLEAFDERDLDRASALLDREPHPAGRVLVGLNTRDLATLATDRSRLRRLRDKFPPQAIAVAESGLETEADAREAARLGYRLALVGSALMRAADPAVLARSMLEGGRQEASRCASA